MCNQTIAKRYHVTDEQLDRVAFYVDQRTNKPHFVVASAVNPNLQYTVLWNSTFNRPQCQCQAAKSGVGCWHTRACMAVLAQHAQERRDQDEALRQIIQDTEELRAEREYRDYLDAIAPYQWPAAQIEHDAERYAPRPFSLLR